MAEKFEQQIEQLGRRVEQQKPHIEAELSQEKKEELIRGEIKDFIREFQHEIPLAPPPRHTREKASGIAALPPSQKVGALITMTFEEGLEEAISVARALNDPALLDEFHDVLVDSFYNELIEREIIKIP